MKLGIIATQMADGADAGAAFAFGDEGLLSPVGSVSAGLSSVGGSRASFKRAPARPAPTPRAPRGPGKTPRRRIG